MLGSLQLRLAKDAQRDSASGCGSGAARRGVPDRPGGSSVHSKRTSLVLELATRGFLVTSKMGVRSTTSPSSNVQVTRTRNIHHVTDTYSTMRVTRSSVHKPNLVADGSNQGYSSEEDILPGGPLLEINEMPQPTASDVAARWINIYHVGVCC